MESEASDHEALTTSLKLAAIVVAAAVPHTNKEMAKCVTSAIGSAKGLLPRVSRADHQLGVWIDRLVATDRANERIHRHGEKADRRMGQDLQGGSS